MAYRNNKWGGYNPQQDENKKKQQVQELVDITAHQKKLAFNVFYNTIEALEEYIEKINYPNFKKQIFAKSINSPNRLPEDLADDFLSQLHCFVAMIKKKPDFLRNEIKEKFYKWIDASKIDVDNCPRNLKHYLFEINEILEGRGENFINQTRKRLDDGKKSDPRDVLSVFSAFQVPINKNREQGKALEGKTHKDLKVESNFDEADSEKGQKIFNKISREITPKQNDFSFYSQQGQNNPQQTGQLMDNGSFAMIGDEVYLPVNNPNEVNTEQLSIIQGTPVDNIQRNVPLSIGGGIAVALIGGVFNFRTQYFKRSLS